MKYCTVRSHFGSSNLWHKRRGREDPSFTFGCSEGLVVLSPLNRKSYTAHETHLHSVADAFY